jgi:hypothetical protein
MTEVFAKLNPTDPFILARFCLLLIDKARAKEKTYKNLKLGSSCLFFSSFFSQQVQIPPKVAPTKLSARPPPTVSHIQAECTADCVTRLHEGPRFSEYCRVRAIEFFSCREFHATVCFLRIRRAAGITNTCICLQLGLDLHTPLSLLSTCFSLFLPLSLSLY